MLYYFVIVLCSILSNYLWSKQSLHLYSIAAELKEWMMPKTRRPYPRRTHALYKLHPHHYSHQEATIRRGATMTTRPLVRITLIVRAEWTMRRKRVFRTRNLRKSWLDCWMLITSVVLFSASTGCLLRWCVCWRYFTLPFEVQVSEELQYELRMSELSLVLSLVICLTAEL